ncbi:hypothetical protein ACFWDI_34740 [Streptomyces sp. NPDC060064]|uniref:hypothetical protein n=1 Tax=Streptomyces sp. NPDC060064 TaxID=3347049 RepID=UPI0036C662C5
MPVKASEGAGDTAFAVPAVQLLAAAPAGVLPGGPRRPARLDVLRAIATDERFRSARPGQRATADRAEAR